MVPLEYTKKPKIIVVKQMQFLSYKALNSKFDYTGVGSETCA